MKSLEYNNNNGIMTLTIEDKCIYVEDRADELLLSYFYNEGMKDMCVLYAKENMVEYEVDYYLEMVSRVRDSILDGRIEECISIINDINVEYLNRDNNILYYLYEHKVKELINNDMYDDALLFIGTKIKESVNITLVEDLEELLLSCVFRTKVDIIQARQHLSERVNKFIREQSTRCESEIERIVREVQMMENELENKYNIEKFEF